MVQFEELRPGVVITYRWGGIGVAMDYQDVWRGRVTYVNPIARLVCIELLEAGHEGLNDCTWWEHIISIDTLH